MVADTMMIETASSYWNDKHERLRLTRSLPTIEGAGSVAEMEYTVSLPDYLWRGYRHSIDRAFVTTAGTGFFIVSVEVAANSPAALRRDWSRAQATFATILNSFRLTSA